MSNADVGLFRDQTLPSRTCNLGRANLRAFRVTHTATTRGCLQSTSCVGGGLVVRRDFHGENPTWDSLSISIDCEFLYESMKTVA
jgi:hypothetical protein